MDWRNDRQEVGSWSQKACWLAAHDAARIQADNRAAPASFVQIKSASTESHKPGQKTGRQTPVQSHVHSNSSAHSSSCNCPERHSSYRKRKRKPNPLSHTRVAAYLS